MQLIHRTALTALAASLALAAVAQAGDPHTGWVHLTPFTQDLDPGQHDRAGYVVELTDDWAFVTSLDAERVGVYRRDGAQFAMSQTLVDPSDYGALFGAALLAHGDRLFVGAPHAHAGADYSGRVHEYRLEGGLWQYQGEVVNPEPTPFGRFGTGLAADGDWLVVGAPGEEVFAGRLQAYRRTPQGLEHAASLGSPYSGLLGTEIAVRAVDGGAAAHVLAACLDVRGPNDELNMGALIPFRVQPDGGFGGPAIQPLAFLEGNDRFGESIAWEGDTVVVGAPGDDTVQFSSGAVYVFEFDPDSFLPSGQLQQVLLPDANSWLAFAGESVAIEDGRIFVGAGNAPVGEVARPGAVFAYAPQEGGGWALEARLEREGGAHGDMLGRDLAAAGDWVLAGAAAAGNLEGEAVLFSLTSELQPGGLAPADVLATAATTLPAGGLQPDAPSLVIDRPPVPGEVSSVVLDHVVALAAPFLAVGSTPAELPLFGDTLLVADPLLLELPVVGPGQTLDLTWAVPFEPALFGAAVHAQAWLVIPKDGDFGFVASNGLALTIGF